MKDCSVFAGSSCPMAPSALALQDPAGLAMLGDCSRSLIKVFYPD